MFHMMPKWQVTNVTDILLDGQTLFLLPLPPPTILKTTQQQIQILLQKAMIPLSPSF